MKWDYTDRRQSLVGRPRIRVVIVHLILRIATNNEGWGYGRIQGALQNLGYYISDQTVGNVLKENGIEPAPERQKKTTWSKFLKAHREVMGAVDFTTVEVWTRSGLTTFYILLVMKLSTRRIEIAGITPNPDAAWVQQMCRNLTDCYDGFQLDTKYLLIDRYKKFCPLRGEIFTKSAL